MKLRLIVLSMGLAMVSISCNSVEYLLPVTHVKEMQGVSPDEGFYYMLPRTVVNVDLTITRKESTPGPYADYAERFLGLDDVIYDHSIDYEISSVDINTFSEPDPSQAYFVPFGAFEAGNPLFVSLTESGLIHSINCEQFDKESLRLQEGTQQYDFYRDNVTFNHFVDFNLQEKVDTITQRMLVDTVTVEKKTLRRSWVEKSTEIRAREVADYIVEIRKKKFDIISGFAEIPYTKEALEYMYTEMEEMEEDYLKLFKGISGESSIDYRFTIIPDGYNQDKPYSLFRFSETEGVINPGRQDAGYEVVAEFHSNNALEQFPVVKDTVDVKDVSDPSFFYRIPEHATVVIKEGNIIRAERRTLINQFGRISRISSKGLPLEFYPNSGSIKTIGRNFAGSKD